MGEDQERIHLDFGCVDPIDEDSGIQIRLHNLGFYEGEIDGKIDEKTIHAIPEFQRSVDLPADGALNDQTRRTLPSKHGE